jgi:primary-amine oxidase
MSSNTNGHISSVSDKNFNGSGPQSGGPHHPLASLDEYEIRFTATLIQNLWPPSTDIHFKVITLLEPPKDELLEYFEAEHEKSMLPELQRKAWVNYYLRNTVS